MRDATRPYSDFRRFLRGLDQFDALLTIWGYHLHVVDGRPLLQGFAADRPPSMDLRKHIRPWALDILSREVILHAGRHPRPTRRLSQYKDLAAAINAVMKMSDVAPDADNDFMLHMHRLAHQQFPWQSGGWTQASVIRVWKIYGGDMLDSMVQSKYGMTMQQIIWRGFATGGNFLSNWGMTTTADYSDPLSIPPEASRAFFETLARTPQELQELARPHQAFNDSWASTWNPLRLFPLVRYDPHHPEYAMCPIPRFAQERITTGVFYDIVKENGFSDAFGSAFQSYIGEIIKATCGDGFTVTPEAEYRVGRDRKNGVDWTVSDGTGVLYIECKAKRMRRGSKELISRADIDADLSEFANAIVQHYKNIDDVLVGRTQQAAPTGSVFMIVVTLESWYMTSTTVRQQLADIVVDRMQKTALPLSMLDTIPWQVVAAQEFEQVAQVFSEEGIASVLEEKVSPDYRDWDLNGFIHRTRASWPARYVPLFPEDEARLFPDWITRSARDPA